MKKGNKAPQKKKALKVHGFRKRMENLGGRKILRRRRLKGRKKLTV